MVINVERKMIGNLHVFTNEEEAWEWVEQEVDDPCIDNYRFAYVGDPEAEEKYLASEADGCCAFFDRVVLVGGRRAKIGCNYGH